MLLQATPEPNIMDGDIEGYIELDGIISSGAFVHISGNFLHLDVFDSAMNHYIATYARQLNENDCLHPLTEKDLMLLLQEAYMEIHLKGAVH